MLAEMDCPVLESMGTITYANLNQGLFIRGIGFVNMWQYLLCLLYIFFIFVHSDHVMSQFHQCLGKFQAEFSSPITLACSLGAIPFSLPISKPET